MKTPFTLFFRNKTNPKFLLKPDTFNIIYIPFFTIENSKKRDFIYIY